MKNKMPRTPFSTGLSGSAKEIELRIRNIMSGPKKRPPLPFLALVFFICIFCGNIVSCRVVEDTPPAGPDSFSPGNGLHFLKKYPTMRCRIRSGKTEERDNL